MSAEQPVDSETLAAYLPRAFAIEFRSDTFVAPIAGTGIPTFDAATFPIFMHEVAHLVQDRGTFRGVMDFLDMWDQIEAASVYVRSANAQVRLPIVEMRSGRSRLAAEYNWAVELAAFRQYREPKRAWTRDRFWAFEDYSVSLKTLTLSGRTINHPFVTAHLIDNATGERYSHSLGAWEIKEAYSVAVGLLHGGEEKQPADWFEYLVIERILARHFGNVSPQHTVAICHWALQDLAPANALFSLIEQLENEHHGLPSVQETYDTGRKGALARGFEANCREVIGMLHQIEQSMLAQDSEMGNMFRWFRLHAEELLGLNLASERRFPLDTFLCERSTGYRDDERTTALRRFFQEVEVPLVVWPEGELYSISNTPGTVDAVFLNRCIADLFERMWNGNDPAWQCPIHRGCTLHFKDDVCRTQPWRKNQIHPTCPYGAAANILGLREGKVLAFEPFDAR